MELYSTVEQNCIGQSRQYLNIAENMMCYQYNPHTKGYIKHSYTGKMMKFMKSLEFLYKYISSFAAYSDQYVSNTSYV